MAVWEENKGVVETLLAHGADADKANNAGVTPLTMAVQEGDEEMVETLHGAVANKAARVLLAPTTTHTGT